MVLSEATVRVTLEVTKFERDLRAKVTEAANKAGRDFDKEMRSQLATTGRTATNDFRNAARTNMTRAGRDAASAFDNEFRAGLGQTAGKAGQRLSQGLRTSVSRAGIDAGRGFADNVANVLEARGSEAGNRLVDSIAVGIARNGNRAGRAVARGIDSAVSTEIVKTGRTAGRNFSNAFSGEMFGQSRALVLGVAALGAYFEDGLRPAVSILAALPGLVGATVTTAGVLITVFKGVGSAIKALGSGDIDKINQAMAGLSPQAQAFAREVHGAGQQLSGLKNDLQEGFFGQFNGQVKDLASILSGTLSGSLGNVATSAGSLARQFTSVFTQAQGVSNLDSLFKGTSGFLDRLGPGLANLTRGFLNFVGASAPGLKDIGQALSDMFTRIGQFLTRSASSGKALAWVEEGIDGVKQLASETGDLVRAFVVLYQAAHPLTAVLGSVSQLAVQLVNTFGDLPGPLQTAALAAILLSRTDLPGFLTKVQSQSAPVARTFTQMGDAYQNTSARAREFISNGAGLPGVARRIGSAFDAVTGTAGRLATSLGTGLTTATAAAANGLSRAGQAAQTGFLRSLLAIDNGVARSTDAVRRGFQIAASATSTSLDRLAVGVATTANAIERGFDSASTGAQVALNRMAIAGREAGNTLRSGLVPTALAIDANVTRAQSAVSRFAGTLTGALANGASTARTAVSNVGTAVAVGFARAVQAGENAANRFGTALQTGVISASIAGNNALNNVGNALRNSVLRPLVDAQGAYRTASTSVREFATAQTNLNAPLSQSPGLLGRLRDGFTEVRAVATGSGQALASLASGPLSAAKRGIEGIGSVAAGVGGSITKGLGSAISGLTGALGGPWGLAITGATVALGFLSSAQDEARQKAAEHKAEISSLADTLDKETGAITAATKQQLLQNLANSDAGQSARALGINMNLVADAASGNVSAQNQLYAALRKSAEAGGFTSNQMKILQDTSAKTGLSMETLENAVLGNQDALGKVKAAFGAAGIDLNQWSASLGGGLYNQLNLSKAVRESAGDLAVQQQHIRDAANAMTPAEVTAQKYADAVGILADKTSDADAKSRALSDALNILAGGTVNAEVAQGRFTETIANLHDQLGTATQGLQGMGSALVDNTGHINNQTTAGAFLIGQYDQISGALTSSVGATIAAGKANGDLEGAYIKVGQQTATARAQFIETARAVGLSETAANQLADAYGLIPAQVLTTVTDQGSALNTQLQITAVDQKLKDLPINTPVTVQGLTQDAINKLNEVGIKTRTLPNGSVEVTATTMEARHQLDALIASYRNRVITFGAAITGGKAMGDIVPNKTGNIVRFAQGGQHMRRMSANRAEMVKPNTWRIIGDRARDDEAYIPINASHRSRALLAETARRMGFQLYGDGGVNGRSTSNPVTQIAAGAIVVNAPYSDPELVAKATLNELARSAVG